MCAHLSDIEELYNMISDKGIMLFNYANSSTPATIIQNRFGAGMFINERMVKNYGGGKVRGYA